MVEADSHGISRAPCYSGFSYSTSLFNYRTFTFFGAVFSCFVSDSLLIPLSHYPTLLRQWFRLFPLRSPLLGESLLFSLPLATKMFQFTRFAHHYFHSVFLGLPHSDISGSLSASDSPKLFAGCYVLLRLCVPRYPPSALLCLTFFLTLFYLCSFQGSY